MTSVVEWAWPSTRDRETVQAVAAELTRLKVVTLPSVLERVKSPLVKVPFSVRSSAPCSGIQPVLAELAEKAIVSPSAVTMSVLRAPGAYCRSVHSLAV